MMARLRACAWGLCLSAAMLLGGACDDDLAEATHIERMRILGSKVVLPEADDPERATPRPGEKVELVFYTVFPGRESSVDETEMMLISCTAPDRYTGGLPICQEIIDALEQAEQEDASNALSMLGEGEQRARCDDIRTLAMLRGIRDRPPGRPAVSLGGVTVQCARGGPEADFEIPDDFKAEQAMFLGVVCERGQAYFDPTDPLFFGCEENDGETIRVHGLIPVAGQVTPENRHPSMEHAEFYLDGQRWEAVEDSELPPDPCERTAGGKVPIVDPLEHTIELTYDADAREEGPEGDLEVLEFSVYATEGGVERRFTLFDEDAEIREGRLSSDLTWDPKTLTTETRGRLVRFYFTVLDQRGGFDIATRAVCLQTQVESGGSNSEESESGDEGR